MSRKITGIGETILDVVFKNNKPIAANPGGSTFNAIISLGRTVGRDFPDVEVCMISETGNDHVGGIISSFMEDSGVAAGLLARNPGIQTPVSLAFLDEDNDAHYQFYRERSTPDSGKIDGIGFAQNDLVLFGSYFAVDPRVREYTVSILHRADAAGAILLYDVNFRKSHVGELDRIIGNILENCALSSIVRGSIDDFSLLFGVQDPERIYREHISALCPILICTCGAEPVHIFTPQMHLQIPVPQVETVSTIGAGDNFNAGLIYSIISMDLKKDDILSISEDTWRRITRIAGSFSAEVCCSIDNYVGKDFIPLTL